MHIAIVGCGTGGQAASLYLHRAGHRVTVFERSPTLAPVGAGLLLQPTGMQVLDELGVGDRIRTLATPVDRLHGVNHAGRTVLDLRYADLSPGLVGMGVHRGGLFATLLDEMERSGIDVARGVTVARYAVEPSGRVAIFDDRDHPLGEFDLLVAADGARSLLRTQSACVSRASMYPFGALWFVADDPDGLYGRTLSQVYRDTRGMIGFLPSGRRATHEPPTVSVFWSIRRDQFEAVREAGIDAFKASVRALTDRAEPVLAQLLDADQLIGASYMDVVMSRTSDGPVVFLGDAAHAMSPQLGQGVNLALLDAQALARSLASLLPDERPAPTRIVESLERCDRTRRANVRYYQWGSRWLTPIFQSRWSLLGLPRDACMGPMCRVGLLRRVMLESLVGIKTGVMPWAKDRGLMGDPPGAPVGRA